MRRTLFLLLVLLGTQGRAQDVLTVGSASAPSGGQVSIPVSLRDRTGTVLGSDAGNGNRIQGLAFKVLYPTDLIASVSFARAGVTVPLTPMFESSLQGSGWCAGVLSFNETSNTIPLTPDAVAPGDIVGTLTVTLQPTAIAGSVATLRIDAPGAMLSNQAGSVRETVAAGTLALVNGSVTVTLPAPTGLVATANGTTEAGVSWNAVTNADHYEVWRSFDGGSFASAGTAPGTSFTDSNVVAGKTYLYRVLAVDGTGGMSAFSNTDAATTVVFNDDPLVAQSTVIQATHVSQLRSAVSSFRVSAGLAPLPSDPTATAGAVVLSTHISSLRTALDEARSAVSMPALTYTDGTLVSGVTLIKAVHVEQLRSGVR